MKSENRSAAFLRKRKMMLVLPLMVIPFLTMAFWALGGGVTSARVSAQGKGLNLNLPAANLKEESGDGKLSFYDRAQKDSAKRKEWMESDPYYKNLPDSAFEPPVALQTTTSHSLKYQPLNTTPFNISGQAPEERLMQKLSVLQKQFNKTGEKAKPQNAVNIEPEVNDFDFQTKHLQNVMSGMEGVGGEDPEIGQLSTTLDKILDIQHPDRVRERLKEKSAQNKKRVFVVTDHKPTADVSLMGAANVKEDGGKIGTGFFGDKDDALSTHIDANAVTAVVHDAQTITSGSTIKLRLTTDVFVGGKLVPKGTFVYGVALLEGERLQISIPAIRLGNSLLPVSLLVYDLDGLAGIYIPGSASNEVAKQSVDQSLGNIGLMTMDPSLKAQAASEGIKAAKSLLSKKVKQLKISLKAGYQVLLRDGNGEQ